MMFTTRQGLTGISKIIIALTCSLTIAHAAPANLPFETLSTDLKNALQTLDVSQMTQAQLQKSNQVFTQLEQALSQNLNNLGAELNKPVVDTKILNQNLTELETLLGLVNEFKTKYVLFDIGHSMTKTKALNFILIALSQRIIMSPDAFSASQNLLTRSLQSNGETLKYQLEVMAGFYLRMDAADKNIEGYHQVLNQIEHYTSETEAIYSRMDYELNALLFKSRPYQQSHIGFTSLAPEKSQVQNLVTDLLAPMATNIELLQGFLAKFEYSPWTGKKPLPKLYEPVRCEALF